MYPPELIFKLSREKEGRKGGREKARMIKVIERID